ncbi:chromate transporter [Romboutsia sp.]|uniref:chromate transporter n=1 Tax=Romboutsia sp. TaxID=1965302 RepID=UPI003F354AEC
MTYLNLFLNFFKIGTLGFGGGYAILPLIESTIVKTNGWITANEFIDLVTISQITPGPILINSATFIGAKEGGILGAICATMGSVVPSLIIIICLSILYYKFKSLSVVQTMLKIIKPAVVGLIAAASAGIVITVLFKDSVLQLSNIDSIGLALTTVSFVLIRYSKINPILVIIFSGVIGMGLFLLI